MVKNELVVSDKFRTNSSKMTNNCPLYPSFCYIRVLLTVVENYEGYVMLQFLGELFTSFILVMVWTALYSFLDNV